MPTEKFASLPEGKRRMILNAMRDEFLEHAYSEIRVSSVIQRAGISRASFYLYFRDKEDLFAGMLEQLDHDIRNRLLSCFREEDGVFSRAMRRMLDLLLDGDEGDQYFRILRRAEEDERCSVILRQTEHRLSGAENRTAYAAECCGLMDRTLYPRADESVCSCAIDMGVMVLLQTLTMKTGGAQMQLLKNLAYGQLEILENGLRA